MMERSNYLFHFLIFMLLWINYCKAQEKQYIATIPPFHSRQAVTSTENPLKLSHLRFFIFVYQNAAAVYSESDFINQADDSVDQEFAIPSTNHDENGTEPGGRISNGILSVQLWIEDTRIVPRFIKNNDEEWYTIQTAFAPREIRKIKALFWVETSLTDIDSIPGSDTVLIPPGKRGFLVDLAHASTWNDNIQSIETNVILRDGIMPTGQAFNVNPPSYELKDSILTWTMNDIEPSEDDNIEISYESLINDSTNNTIARLSEFIVKSSYDQLLYFVRQLDQE